MTLLYAFAVLAIGRSEPFAWAAMAIDSVLVAYLGVVMTAVNYRIAERVTRRCGVALLPRRGEAANGMALAR